MEILTGYILPCLWAFGACGAFCVLFNSQGAGVWICGSGGALGWLTYVLVADLGGGKIICALAASVAVSAWSEAMARLRRCPVTSYLLVSLFPLVPGGGIYYAMEYAIRGENQRFAETLMETFGIAGALALGVLLVSSAVRMWRTFGEMRTRG